MASTPHVPGTLYACRARRATCETAAAVSTHGTLYVVVMQGGGGVLVVVVVDIVVLRAVEVRVDELERVFGLL